MDSYFRTLSTLVKTALDFSGNTLVLNAPYVRYSDIIQIYFTKHQVIKRQNIRKLNHIYILFLYFRGISNKKLQGWKQDNTAY